MGGNEQKHCNSRQMCSKFLYLDQSVLLILQWETSASSGQVQSRAGKVAAHLGVDGAPSWPNRTNPRLGNSAILLQRYKHQRDMKKKAQYVEISHACRAQKRLEPIIIILLQVLLLKVANTASTLADFSLVGCRFFFFSCLRNKTNLPSADS